MQFCGMTYNSFMSAERKLAVFNCNDAYSALEYADKCWQRENKDSHYPRLLVVIKREKENGNECYAFFEFANSQERANFIERKGEFVYSTEKEKIWNGNPCLMM